jgi:hypothetical protein
MIAKLIPSRSASVGSERRSRAVLRVHLHGLLKARAADGIDSLIIRDFMIRWFARAKAAAPVRTLMSARLGLGLITHGELLRWFRDCLRPSEYFLSSRTLGGAVTTSEPWSFQTDAALEHWFDSDQVPQVAKFGGLNRTDVKRIQHAFRFKIGVKPGAVAGRPGFTLWSTWDIRPGEKIPGSAPFLRDVLGLYDRSGREYAFLVRLAPAFGDIGAGCAPTVFDSGGYARFRPWPHDAGSPEPHLGRTYDLDAGRRAAAAQRAHGRAEIVTLPRGIVECQDLLGLGYIGKDADSSAASFEAFADEVCPGMTVAALVAEIDAL